MENTSHFPLWNFFSGQSFNHPLVVFLCRIMGDFTNGVVSRIFATLLSFLVITINIYFVVSYVIGEMPTLYGIANIVGSAFG
jgi:hypothetical protein